MKFTFCICAYGDNPRLEDVIRSTLNQTLPSRVLIATSTPSEYIRTLAEKYSVPLVVNPEKKGIARDWEFAIMQAETPYAVIAHQDDVYFPDYARRMTAAFEGHPEALIAFSDYGDLCGDNFCCHRFYLYVKRLLLWRFYLKHSLRSIGGKLSALRFGNAICCPSVSYNLSVLGRVEFPSDFSVNLDWAMWLKLARMQGSFVYIPKALMGHHVGSLTETNAAIADNRRYNEDMRIFELMWGKRIARIIMWFYKSSYSSNTGA